MKLIPSSFFADRKGIRTGIACFYIASFFAAKMAYDTYSEYKIHGIFRGGKGYISYGHDAAFPAYGLTITFVFISLYFAYLLVCATWYLFKGDCAAKTLGTNYVCCNECKFAFEYLPHRGNTCELCGGCLTNLEEYKKLHHEHEASINYSQVNLPENVDKQWTLTEVIFTAVLVLILVVFHIWAYYSNITAN